MTDYEAERFCQTFADGLDSGIGYARVLDILERQKFDHKIVDRLRSSLLEHGDMLGEALARLGLLDASARELVLVAEKQGSLPDTFEQLARIYRQRYKRKKKIAFSFVEPLIMIALGIALTNLLGRNIVAMVFSDDLLGHFLDWVIGTAIQVGLFGLAAGTLIVGWLNLPVDMKMREAAAGIWMRVPLVSEASRKLSISLFCRYLKESLANGMTVFDGLELAAKASRHPHVLSTIDEAKLRIEEGSTLAQALRAVPSLPNKVIDQIDIGEESGRLEDRLGSLAADFEEQSDEAFERLRGVTTWIIRYSVVILVIGTVFLTVVGLAPS
ncbi:MAG: type II secretion system F family protein [Myxococcota bacterium]